MRLMCSPYRCLSYNAVSFCYGGRQGECSPSLRAKVTGGFMKALEMMKVAVET